MGTPLDLLNTYAYIANVNKRLGGFVRYVLKTIPMRQIQATMRNQYAIDQSLIDDFKYDEQIEKLITQVQRLQAQINMFLHKIFELKQKIFKDKEKLNDFQEELIKGSFFQFNEQLIERLTLIPNFIKQSKSLTTSKTHDVEENIQLSQELPLLIDQIRLKKYEIFQIEELKEGQSIYASQISPDEKFLVSGGSDYLVKIWDLYTQKQLKKFQLNSWVRQIQFTSNSRYLGIGDYDGRLIIIDLSTYRKLFDMVLHTKQINDICFINDTEVITCSADNQIIKTLIKQKTILFKIEPHTDLIRSIDYDPVEDVFVSGSDDASIKLFDASDGNMLIEKIDNNQNYVFQVQILSNLNKVISLYISDKLKIWIIDYESKTLKLQQIIDESIYNFSIVLQQQFILLICEQFVKFYTIDGSFVRQIDHCLPEICINYQLQRKICINKDKWIL